MKYETPQLISVIPALNVINSTPGVHKGNIGQLERLTPNSLNDLPVGYADWE